MTREQRDHALSLCDTALLSCQHNPIRGSCFCLPCSCGVADEVGNSKLKLSTTWDDKRMVTIKTKPRRIRQAWRNLKKKEKGLLPTERQYSVKKVPNTIKLAPPPLTSHNEFSFWTFSGLLFHKGVKITVKVFCSVAPT